MHYSIVKNVAAKKMIQDLPKLEDISNYRKEVSIHEKCDSNKLLSFMPS